VVEPVQKSGKMFRWWEGRVGDGYVVRMGREETLPSPALPRPPLPPAPPNQLAQDLGEALEWWKWLERVVRCLGWWGEGPGRGTWVRVGREKPSLPTPPHKETRPSARTEIHPKGRHAIRKARVVLIVMIGVFPFDFCPIAVIEASS